MIDGTVLAYIPSPPQGVWHIGPVPIRAYALCIIVGIIVAVWWGSRRWQARGGRPGEVIDVALWAVPFGLIGGRLYHVLTDWETYFGPGGKGLGGAFRIWDGGLGIWGAVALGAVGAWIGARNMGIRLPPFGDALAPAILLAQAIGRFGNYFNQELFGRPTTVPWGLEIFDRETANGIISYKLIDGVSTGQVYAVVHPTFLYEMIWNVLVVIALVLIDRRFRVGHGRLFAMYVAGYCVGRFIVELMRDDFATHVFGVRINVFTAAIVFLCAALYVVMAPKGRETGLSMYWPDRAEELAAEGVVGYVAPDTGRTSDEDEAVADADTGPSDPEPEPVLAEPEPETEPVLAEPEPETEPVLAEPEPEPETEPVLAEPEPEPETEPAEPESEPEPETEQAASLQTPTPTGTGDSMPPRGYTVVPADDEELSGITIIEQNPGGAAGAIEIRRAADTPTEPGTDADTEADADVEPRADGDHRDDDSAEPGPTG